MTQSSPDSRYGLLPCPFCGAPARTDLLPHAQGPGWVQCSACECDQHMSDTLEEAVVRWNTRAAPSPSSAGSGEVLIQRWLADARQLEEAAKQEDIGDEEAALNKYCAEQLRRCIRDVEGIHGAAQRPLMQIAAPGNDQLSKLWNAIVENTKGDGFWIGEILLTTLELEVGFNPAGLAVTSTHREPDSPVGWGGHLPGKIEP